MKSSLTALLFLLLVMLLSNSYSQDLVAYYPFDKNANDHSGNSNHGTVYGATLTADRFGNSNAAYSFDGIDDYIEVFSPQKLDLTSWTISGWISITAFPAGDGTSIIGKHHNSQEKYNYTIFLTPEPILSSQYEVDNDPTDFDHNVNYSLTDYNLNNWLFFTSSRDEITGRHVLFINGVLSEENWWTDVPSTSPENLFIGRIVSDLPEYFNGLIDDIRIYDDAFSDPAIDWLYAIERLDIPAGTTTSLWAKFNATFNSLGNGNKKSAINQMNAFIKEVEAQRGKKLTDSDADALIAKTQAFMDEIDAASLSKKISIQQDPAIPVAYGLFQNYPNPFNPSTTIRFNLPEATNVNLSIYNVSGQLLSTLVDQYSDAGSYNVQWIAHDCPSGIYLVHLRTGGFSTVMRMMLLK